MMIKQIVVLTITVSLCTSIAQAGITAGGDVSPADPATWDASTDGYIGETGAGSIIVDAGSSLRSQQGYLGYEREAAGVVIVSDGATWDSDNLDVGGYGSGTLMITSGGHVVGFEGLLAREPGSTGMATVSGFGSSWDSMELVVGYRGSAALTISNNGAITSNMSRIGSESGSTGMVTVSGAGSTWTNFNELCVGYYGDATLYITNGGAVRNTWGQIALGPDSTGEMTVSGAGSTWTNSDDLFLGELGDASLYITDGGVVSNTSGTIGNSSGSTGAVTVRGANSTWTNSNDLHVGYFGDGTLSIYDGGLVSVAGGLTIAWYGGGDSFINMGSGGMLALFGEADASLGDFLGLIGGTDAIRYWNESIWGWADITGATPGDDYSLSYLSGGDLDGYTVLTVNTPVPIPGDSNRDYIVDGLDLVNLVAQFGGPPDDESGDFNGDGFIGLEDFGILRAYFGSGVVAAAPEAEFTATTPEPATMSLLAIGGLVVLR